MPLELFTPRHSPAPHAAAAAVGLQVPVPHTPRQTPNEACRREQRRGVSEEKPLQRRWALMHFDAAVSPLMHRPEGTVTPPPRARPSPVLFVRHRECERPPGSVFANQQLLALRWTILAAATTDLWRGGADGEFHLFTACTAE